MLIVGPTIEQTTDIVNQAMKNISLDAPEDLVRRAKSESRWYIGESELIVGGFNINNAARQRGKSLYRIYIEEIRDSNPDQYHDAMRSDLAPALTHSIDGKMIYLTTLPDIPDHPFVTHTIPEAQLKDSFYSYTINDNKKLTPEQKQKCIDLCGGEKTVEFRREYMNEMVRDQSIMVVPDYDEAKHIQHIVLPRRYFPHITMDWGGVKDMTCALLHTYDFLNNRYVVMDEKVFPANTDTNIIVNSVKEWITHKDPDHPMYPVITVDAPGQLIVDLISLHGLTVRSVPKQDWLSAVNNMSVKFSEPNRIVIHEKCSFLRQSLRSGTFNKKRTDFERTQALGHCDGLAALMYAVRVQNTLSPFSEAPVPGGIIYESPTSLSQIQRPITYEGRPKKFGGFK